MVPEPPGLPPILLQIWAVARREIGDYLATPVAAVFLALFAALAAALPFYLGGLLARGEASLEAFFQFHPWLYLLFLPALGMRLWAEERRSGTIEILLSLPSTTMVAVLGKFIAAWTMATIGLVLTAPIWITVNYLGDPDNGAIFAGYVGSWLMAGGMLALSAAASAATRSQVVAFLAAALVNLVFLAGGLDAVVLAARDWVGPGLAESLGSLGATEHYDSIARGLIGLRDVGYFLSMILIGLIANTIFLDLKRTA